MPLGRISADAPGPDGPARTAGADRTARTAGAASAESAPAPGAPAASAPAAPASAPAAPAPASAAPAVALRAVVVRYGEKVALEASLSVAPGERVALDGPSGAGKRTVLGLCSGARALSAGSVDVLGTDLATATPRQLRALRARIGTVHQRLDLVGPLSALQNVSAGRLGRWGLTTSLISLIRPVQAEPALAAMRSLGIEDLARTRTERLSGGEQQRVALARLLVQDPALVLADEPISSLDPERARAVMQMLAEVVATGQRTLLISLHDFDVARETCDRVVGLRQGRIVFDLPAAEVTARHRDALYRLET